MRVLVVGPMGPDAFAENMVSSLGQAGHEVRAVETWTHSSPGGRRVARARPLPVLGPLEHHLLDELQRRPRLAARLQAGVVEAAEDHRPELTVVMDASLSAKLVPRIRRATSGAPVVLWFPDGMGRLGREAHLLCGYDALFGTDAPLAERYRELRGLNAHLLPEACNPIWHRPPDGQAPGDAGPAVLMLGSVYPTRFLLLRRLLDAGLQVELRGGHTSRVLPRGARLEGIRRGGDLVHERKAAAFRRAAVVLNDVASTEASHLNCRLFEAAASGAAVLTEWRDGLADLFDAEREVRPYRTFDELVRGARELIEDRVAARRIGDSATKRARDEHTYAHRFARMVEVLGRG
jgi:spore maturation protein CgeB